MQRGFHGTGGKRHAAATRAVRLRAVTAILLVAAPVAASAQASGTDCRIDVTSLDFGEYSALDPFPNLAIGRVIVDCRGSNAFPARVSVSPGRGGNPFRPGMARGSPTLVYNI